MAGMKFSTAGDDCDFLSSTKCAGGNAYCNGEHKVCDTLCGAGVDCFG